jgi:hypothetical protein
LHHLQRVRLAKEVRGGTDPVSVEQADIILRQELQRREGLRNVDEV